MSVGKALFEAVKSLAVGLGCYNVTLNVWACNPDAKKFYESPDMHIRKFGMETVLTGVHRVVFSLYRLNPIIGA